MVEDIRFALRLIRKNAGLCVAAALLLALGLGGNSAVFALLYLVFQRPLPGVHDSRRLAAATLLLATAGAACWMPARRASRVDPVVSLRHE